MSRAFVSYPYGDAASFRGQLARWARDGLLGSATIVHEKEDVRSQGKHEIDRYLRSVMQDCDTLLVLVGENTHNRPWLDREAEVAISRNMRIVLVRLPGTRGAPPAALRNSPSIAWSPAEIKRALT